MAAARAHGLARRADTRGTPVAKGVLHHAVFAGVVRNHDQDPFRLQPFAEPVERTLVYPAE